MIRILRAYLFQGYWWSSVYTHSSAAAAPAPDPRVARPWGPAEMEDQLLQLLPARKGHFQHESGHHGDLWLDLELLCLHPDRLQPFAAQLATRLVQYDLEAVCGPLVEGAFVALMLAPQLGVSFTYSERFENPGRTGLYPVKYRIPAALRGRLRGRRVAIVNDVIGAGSAVLGTLEDLEACGANVVAIGTLAVLGSTAARFAAEKQIALEVLLTIPGVIWSPEECPQCVRQVPLSTGSTSGN